MNVTNLLTGKSLSLVDALGGWRTFAEAVASRVLFLIIYLFTGQVLTSALVAVGSVLVFTVIQLRNQAKKWWQAAIPLAIVGLSALLAGGTGNAMDFYLQDILPELIIGLLFLVSMLIRLPVIGLVIGGARGERFAWRRDRAQRRLYQRCTAVFLAKFAIAAVVMVSLYLAGSVLGLGVASTVLTTPALAGCIYLCWRMLRAEQAASGRAVSAPTTTVPDSVEACQSTEPR
jgi:hypothetical protein